MVDGSLEVTRPVPSEELLSKYQASPERRLWWEERISSILAQGGFDEYLN
jgi:hypothetical protein